MVRLTVFAIALVSASIAAQADFKPGRIRVDAKGSLEAVQATGSFRDIDRATVLQEVEDGGKVVGYLLLTDKGEVHFAIRQTRNSRCGPMHIARSDSEKGIDLIIRDSATAPKCRIPEEWMVEVRKGDSRLLLEGSPRRYFLTQGEEER